MVGARACVRASLVRALVIKASRQNSILSANGFQVLRIDKFGIVRPSISVSYISYSVSICRR